MPPWCSSGRKANVLKTPLDDITYFNDRKCRKNIKQIRIKRRNRTKYIVIIMIAFSLTISFLLPYIDLKTNNIKKMLLKSDVLSLPSTDVEKKFCDRLKRLQLQLKKAEKSLRTTLRHRNTVLQSENYYKEYPIQYIVGCKATQGSETTEWAGSVTLLGLLPLWRATLPPDTVLAVRPPTPGDCWPFSDSYGEIIIELPKLIQVDTVSVEHVRPDTARSAPKHFKIFGVLSNGTWVKGASGIYTYNRPPKQYFTLNINKLVKQIILRVLSNHGNNKYTCIYRIHLYTKYTNEV